MVAGAGAFHSIGIPQWLGAATACAAGARVHFGHGAAGKTNLRHS